MMRAAKTGRYVSKFKANDPRRLRSPLVIGAFSRYLRWHFRRHFRAVRLSRGGVPRLPGGRPAIIYTNHPSWWDPAFLVLLATELFPDRQGYGPMSAATLAEFGILSRVGVFAIHPESPRGAAQFLRISSDLLTEPSAMLWVTPEGEFTDARARPIRLRPGIAHLARRIEDAVLVPLAIEYPFWNESQPEALARFGQPLEATPARHVWSWTALLEAELTRAMDALAEESMKRDPALFHTLLRGSMGVGGVHDLWRRARALVPGHSFEAEHERLPPAREKL